MSTPPPRVAVAGSLNMDLQVTAPSRPRPGETILGEALSVSPGGKGLNQAVAAARAGAAVSMAGSVGRDEHGDTLCQFLHDDGIRTDGVARSSERTGTAHITVADSGENSIVVVPGANGDASGWSAGQLADIAQADAVLLQLEIPLSRVVEAAVAARGVVALTPAPVMELPDDLLSRLDLIIANEHEAAVLTGPRGDPVQMVQELAGRIPGLAVVTLGAHGCVFSRRWHTPVQVPALAVPVVDTTAAGDTFAAVLVTSLLREFSDRAAVDKATAAAAVTVQRAGAAASIPTREETSAMLDQFNRTEPALDAE